MRKIILTAALAFAATTGALSLSTPANAANAPWCATSIESDGSLDCSFQSRQQCQAFVSGRGGQCDMNVRNTGGTSFTGSFARYDAAYTTDDINNQRP
jgi:hypothetical protein